MIQATAILGLRAQTSIHAGAEGSRGAIDLPVQREIHSGWPVIFNSSVKGALRELAVTNWGNTSDDITAIFGPENPTAETSRAGALRPNEARLLALPIQALNTAYKWVTCPDAIRRLLRDCAMFGIDSGCTSIPMPNLSEAISYDQNDPKRIFLREFLFEKREVTAEDESVLRAFITIFGPSIESEIRQKLLIVSDSRFAHLMKICLAVPPHIALDENKNTKNGALWFEELLPPETLMYMPLGAEQERLSKKQQSEKRIPRSKQEILEKVLALFKTPYFRVGANESTGMGMFYVQVVKPSVQGE